MRRGNTAIYTSSLSLLPTQIQILSDLFLFALLLPVVSTSSKKISEAFVFKNSFYDREKWFYFRFDFRFVGVLEMVVRICFCYYWDEIYRNFILNVNNLYMQVCKKHHLEKWLFLKWLKYHEAVQAIYLNCLEILTILMK